MCYNYSIAQQTEWISNGVDHISKMVGSMFLEIDDLGNENICTEKDLLNVIHELDKQNKPRIY